MLRGRVRTLAGTGIMIVAAAALVTLSTSAASAATTTASAQPGHVSATVTADASGCVTEDFSEADEGTYEVCVRDEQILLNNLWNGYVLSNLQEIAVDGYYGPQTESDVVMFQSNFRPEGVTVDGITGPQTWWWLCHINGINGYQGVYWHGAGCATEGSSPPS
ncbi:MAG TPA: peptidoglycan-binding domain-containing protein [Streptosporangiaceae bacterium]|jgi:peptidoglycan hydrolase-like protein with peptidoglycan-binding domain|nr:peptidoglycan-binding domain-containing protein [Streptosporangiaceae bacterium]